MRDQIRTLAGHYVPQGDNEKETASAIVADAFPSLPRADVQAIALSVWNERDRQTADAIQRYRDGNERFRRQTEGY